MDPTEVIERFAELLGAGDVRQALALYEDGAAFVVEPGTIVTGHEAIGRALEGFAAMRPVLTGDIEQVVYAGDLALVTNRWTLDGRTQDGGSVRLAGRSADVLRRTTEGEWKIAIDDPWGGST
jgi:ketosteroid isomerase-like protein